VEVAFAKKKTRKSLTRHTSGHCQLPREPARYSPLDGSVLVLNRFFAPVHVVPVRRCMILLYRELAEVVSIDNGQYGTHDFLSWTVMSELTASQYHDDWGGDSAEQPADMEWIRTPRHPILVPRIVRLLRYDRVPRPVLRFNRRTLFARDDHACQYCGKGYPLNQLSLDHVVPRSRGGETSWENVVCCCLRCNNRKGDRSPSEVGMQLLRRPQKPQQSPVIMGKLANPRYRQWQAFLGTDDHLAMAD